MFEFVFDLPLVVTGPAIIGSLCLFAVVGVRVVRRHVLPRLRVHAEDSHFIGPMVHSVMVFYGLAVALMAVSVSETHTRVGEVVSREATALAALYRDVSGYPEAIRPQLQNALRDYVRQIIHDAWPLQRRGLTPSSGVELVDRFQATLVTFEPMTEGQKLLHGETLRAHNEMVLARRMRLDAVHTGLPAVMWGVIIAGAFIGLTSAFFFKVEDERLHRIMVLLLAAFVGLVIFMVLALDRPFRGDLGLSAHPYQLIYDQLMAGK